ncbi:MAG: 3-deoxy-D-manno-octulosonic acid transferase [Betaproteobacteria bacterium]
MSTPRSTPSGLLTLAHALLAMLAPVWRVQLRRRLARGKETERSVAEKLVQAPAPRPPGPLVWGHAVGLGEAQSLAGLFAEMAEELPDHHFLITSSARSSGQALERSLPPRCLHQFAPIDTPATVRRFLDHWQPALALWCEMDLWPVLVSHTRARGVPMALVNARVKRSALPGRLRMRAFYAALLAHYDRLYAQDEASAQALKALGAPADRVRVATTVKALARPLPCSADELSRLQASLRGRPVWLGASTHAGEEPLLLEAHARLLSKQPDALLVLAPRYPARGPDIEALAPTAGVRRRAAGQAPDADTTVYVADTVGEMGLWCRLACVAFVGGSITPVGGHNPFEPLALGCAVLHGPQVANFEESYAALDAQGLALKVSDAQHIATAVEAAWAADRAQQLVRWQACPLQTQARAMVQDLVRMARSR